MNTDDLKAAMSSDGFRFDIDSKEESEAALLEEWPEFANLEPD